MRRALALARRGEGLTRPNPPVGAVVVRAGRVVGEEFHRKAGGPHAEVTALRRAGQQARGGTLYVTLEPCSTWGRTPPCTEAILNAGIRRVVVACRDPNPKHAGAGLRILRRKGLEVVEGVCRAEAHALLAPFAKWITTGQPWLTLKLGMTLDGRLADARGRSRWITSPQSRRMVHDLRRRADAVLVGRGTAEADNPSLMPVPARGRLPWRIVLDQHGRLPHRHRIFTDGLPEHTIVVLGPQVSARQRAWLARQGAEQMCLPVDRTGLKLKDLMRALGRLGILHVVCEGGAALAGSLLRQGLVDETWFFVAPRLLGEGVPAVRGVAWSLDEAPTLRIEDVCRSGPDVWIRAVRKES